MIVLLWLFQIVFLDEFYKAIKKNEIENTEKNFALELKRSANPSINDGNGFGIVKYINLKEII